MIRTAAFLLGAAAVSLTAPALAGPCSQQISALEKQMSSKDAGAGPVSSGNNNNPAITEAGSGTRATTEASRTAAEIRTPGQGASGERTGPTGSMNQATSGSAASPQDVQRQQQGQPTAAQAARTGVQTGGQSQSQAMAALDRARNLDKAGDTGCMSAVDDAKRLLGTP